METQERKGRTPSMAKKAQIAVILFLIVSFFADLFVYLFVDCFTIGYFLFIMFLVVVPLIFMAVYLHMKTTKHVCAKEGGFIKTTWANFLLISILFAFFILSDLQKWHAAVYIFGALTLIVMMVDMIKNFTGDTYLERISFLAELVFVMAVAIGLIYSIPEAYGNLKTIVTPIVASVLGSLIALVGVAWTIKHNDLKKLDDIKRLEQEKRDDIRRLEQEKREDERKRIKPCFALNVVIFPIVDLTKTKTCITDRDTGRKFEFCAELENSNVAPILLKRVYHDKEWYDLIVNTTVLQGDKVCIDWLFDISDDMYLEVEDMMGNPYYYLIKVLPSGALNDCGQEFYTFRFFKEVTKEEIPAMGDKVSD